MRICGVVVFAAVLTLTSASSSFADVYTVKRTWNDGPDTASLTGTVALPTGSYTIMNGTPNPFTAVNLTLDINGVPHSLTQANMSNIFGTGKFFITATNADLTFNTAGGNGSNGADLFFLPPTNTGYSYVIGSDGNPAFQNAFMPGGDVISSVSFPTVFGVTPEPACLGLAALAPLALMRRGRRIR
jgi:hypothetical protein